MKKLHSSFCALVLVMVVSCMHNDKNISITYSDSYRYYSMEANFSKGKTRAAEQYLDRRLGSSSNRSFVNTKLDGPITLDDHTTFYIQKSPGVLKIELDKAANSQQAYLKIKSICEGIKPIIINSQ